DFVVPAGPGWNVTGVEVQGVYDNGPGPAASVNVRVYANGAGNLPGTLVAERLNQSFTGGPNFVVTLSPLIGLLPGTYWLSIQADQSFASAGQWFCTNRTGHANAGAPRRNPPRSSRSRGPVVLDEANRAGEGRSPLAEPGRGARRLPGLGPAHDLLAGGRGHTRSGV